MTKRNFILALCAMSLYSAALSAQNVIVYTKSGEKTKFKAEDVEKVVFQAEKPFDATNLLSEYYVPDDGFRTWIDQNIGDGSGYLSLETAAAYTGTIDISRIEDIKDITGIEYFTNLTRLDAEDSYFGDFNIGALKKLKYVKIINTKVTNLDFTGLEDLETAYISRNKITTLNLAKNPKLRILYCDCNQLTSLDLTGLTGLEELVCSINQLNSLILPDCPLKVLAAHTNTIYSINLSGVVSTLEHVSVSACGLSSLDLTGASRLTYAECSENPFLTAPILKGCKRLESFRMEDIPNEMGEMDLSECPKINMLRLDRSKIGKKIDLSKCPRLYELSLESCGLEEINVSGLVNLGYVNVSDNRYTRLDVSESDGIYLFFSNLNKGKNAQIKVWKGFDIPNAGSKHSFYCDETVRLVYEFTN